MHAVPSPAVPDSRPSSFLPPMRRAVEAEVKLLCEAALAVARDVVVANRPLHTALSAELRAEEKVEGAALQSWLEKTEVPQSLRDFVLHGAAPAAARDRLSALGLSPTKLL